MNLKIMVLKNKVNNLKENYEKLEISKGEPDPEKQDEKVVKKYKNDHMFLWVPAESFVKEFTVDLNLTKKDIRPNTSFKIVKKSSIKTEKLNEGNKSLILKSKKSISNATVSKSYLL